MVIQSRPSSVDHAPIDPSALADSLLPFGSSRMLPRAAYVDPDVFAWEKAHFFGGSWMCVGRSEDIAKSGDQRAVEVGGSGVLLTRDNDGVLHAFANTCRHRGHELLGCGLSINRRVITCPYHSWGYDLSGGLRAAKGFTDKADFTVDQWGLLPLPVTEWHGLIFVDGSAQAAPLQESLGDLEEIVAPYELERLKVAGSHEYEVAANWKILTENYHECYHCPVIHPELCSVSPPSSGHNYDASGAWVGGTMELRDGMDTMSLDGTSNGVMLRSLGPVDLRTVIYLNVFPNILISLHPDYVMVHRLTPLAADRTRVECSWAFAPEAVERDGFDPSYAMDFWDITNRQDWTACESVQRGLTSPHAVPGPLSAEEDAVYQFVTMVARGYQGQHVTNRTHATKP
jgi:glycine betaine catabolism A